MGWATPFLYWSQDVPDAEWLGAVADPAVVDDAWRAWRSELQSVMPAGFGP
jgi:hypothetical protein